MNVERAGMDVDGIIRPRLESVGSARRRGTCTFGGSRCALVRALRLVVRAASVGGAVAIQAASPVAAGGPANDRFSLATVIASLPATFTVDTSSATDQASEPHPSGCPTSKTIWYRYKATTSGRIDIDTTGSNFPTVVAVYTGAKIGTLSLVACTSAVHGQDADT